MYFVANDSTEAFYFYAFFPHSAENERIMGRSVHILLCATFNSDVYRSGWSLC